MRIALRRRKNGEPTSPRVGIIYFVEGELLIDSTPLDHAGRYGDFRIHERGHNSYWAELSRSGRVPSSECEEYPRGQVAYYTKSGKFALLADECILSQKDVVREI
jgi:hypothetical protein